MTSVISEGRPTLAGYRTFLADPFSWTVMANTIRSAGLITLICLVARYPAAFALARAAGPLPGPLLAPLLLAPSVRVVVEAVALTILLRSARVVERALLWRR